MIVPVARDLRYPNVRVAPPVIGLGGGEYGERRGEGSMVSKVNILKPDHHYILEAIAHLDAANQVLGKLFSLQKEEISERDRAQALTNQAGTILRALELQIERRI